MGKKRVVKKSKEEVLEETEAVEEAEKKARQKGKKKKLRKGRAYIHSTYNNTKVTITDEDGNVIAWSSSGAVGFRGPKKATPYAASRVVEILAEKVDSTGLQEVDVYVKGIGSGRESAIRALEQNGIQVNAIKDVTPVPHNGPRPPKPRRV